MTQWIAVLLAALAVGLLLCEMLLRRSQERRAAVDAAQQKEKMVRLESILEDQRKQNAEYARAEDERFERLRQAVEQNDRNLRREVGQQLERMYSILEGKLNIIQNENREKLESIRATVDEKLSETLNKRLGESFTLVNERLEAVYKSLGEMQTLAVGVGDLKNILTNVKTRGTWGEIQLDTLLSQVLAPGQYEKNVALVPGARERVDFAICLPGMEDKKVYLPIDAKFPMEDYQRIVAAGEAGDKALLDAAVAGLEAAVKKQARSIAEKYIQPPYTTDFACMFLPTEGLYAEVIRRPGLCETLQQTCRVVVAGPTTIAALLNSLQVGFRTLAIEKRSSEVWSLLGAVKTEFGKFADILARTQKNLQQAANTIEDATRKTRTIERKLRNVEQLEQAQASQVMGLLDDASLDE